MRQIYKVYTIRPLVGREIQVVDRRTGSIVNTWGMGEKSKRQAQEFADILNDLLEKQGGNKTPYRVTVFMEVEARDETDAMAMVCAKLEEEMDLDWSVEGAEEI